MKNMPIKPYVQTNFNGWKLIRRTLGLVDELEFFSDRCAFCDICTLICPQEALSFSHDGEGFRKQLVIDQQKCVWCGYCIAFCPFHALDLRNNEKRVIPIVETGVFHRLIQSGQVKVKIEDAVGRCPGCQICVAQCPQQALELRFVENIPRLYVDYSKCAGCGSCEVNCPMGIIESKPVFEGFLEINMKHAQNFRQQLSKICPLDCFILDDNGKLQYFDHSCILCGACIHIPRTPEDMIVVHRTKMRLQAGYSENVTEAIKKTFLK